MLKETSESKFVFVGNHRCLDFINTQTVKKGRPADLIGDSSDLVEWLKEAEVLDSSEAKEALREWNGKPEGERTLERALAFRTILRDMIGRIVS